MFKFVNKLRRNEEGATAIEYGLIAALIAIGLIAALGSLEDSISGNFNNIGTALDGAATPAGGGEEAPAETPA
ncbi:Flp family type IVb pilin [Kordiimonas sp. SCSIO 12610]|uniref:Flp family type IVb pilin n=1 Tax=Kordiimonas sp. SCSIO 12610 TaxID=2829597 RepID=UPI00210CF506|nr:Flp family type IVb pilin [Kordiimonas sp. SCSIO 12610]UTW56010.1 Flp family type IVb pilin [Kordiimonas sp. SCSIO 12610]